MLGNFKNILYATDLSANSGYALRYATGIAKAFDAKIHILHVVEALSEDARLTMQMFILDEKLRNDAINNRKTSAQKRLDSMLDDYWKNVEAADQGIKKQIASVNIIEAYPAEGILTTSRKFDCDLVVLGAHAQGISHSFLGTVAKRVLRRSSVPTLIIPSNEID